MEVFVLNNVKRLRGVGVATVTPMNDDGTVIDYESIDNYVDFLIEKDIDGMFVLGTTGEGVSLPLGERKKVLERFLAANNNRVQITAHCGSGVTEDIDELLTHASNVGADAAAIVLPYFFSNSEDEIYNFYSDILKRHKDFPIYMYNIPQLTKNWISLDTLGKLIKNNSNLIGIKDSSGDFLFVLDLIERFSNRIDVVVGCDYVFMYALIAGAVGCVSGPAAIFPEYYVKIKKAIDNNDSNSAFDYQKNIKKMNTLLENGGNIFYLKQALEARGVKAGGVKSPLYKSDKFDSKRFTESLKKVATEINIEL
jgi:4-hydroxy-tetrahydrodipicolinate synthase